jgi:glycine/D-amino acid oxidase-like deaminating enzyme
MPDVIVIGGGVIGTTAAWQLAEQGAEVLLLERGVLAGGSTGRSQGLLLPPDHDALSPLFEESTTLYRSLAARSGLDLGLDDEPIGTLLLATDETQLAGLSDLDAGTLLDDEETMAEEPALDPAQVAGGLLLPGGGRSDPVGLTTAAAAAAREAGAVVRCHSEVRRLGRGVVICDDGTHHAPQILVAAGAWSRPLLHPLGYDLPVRPVRGWLAVTAPLGPTLRHVVYEAGYTEPDGPAPGTAVTMAELAAGRIATEGAPAAHALGAHRNSDGAIMIGASRSPALREGDESAEALARNAARACELIPSLAEAEVARTWSGLRPFSEDGLPHIGAVEDGLWVCAGHGSEGVLSGAGSGRLVAELIGGRSPFTDPAAFVPRIRHIPR